MSTRLIDILVSVGLLVGVASYAAAWPHNLPPGDEAYFLYEAHRILEGAVLYRDIFWLATPGAHWLMAAVFEVFGVSMNVARLAMAVVHALITAGVYLACRRLGVPRALAMAAALVHPALCFAPWPYASPHWFATLCTVSLLYVTLGPAWADGLSRPFVAGLVVGVLTTVQHQQGAVFAAAIGLLLVLERRIATVAGGARRRLAAFATGILLLVGPTLAIIVGTAGLGEVADQLFWQPLTGYRQAFRTSWGAVSVVTWPHAEYTWPRVLALLILVVPLAALRTWRCRRDPGRARRLLALTALGVAAPASILYFPDFIHLAFIAPLLSVLWADALAAVPWPTVGGRRVVPVAVGIALMVALGVKLERNLEHAWRRYPHPYETPFGRVDLHDRQELEFVMRVRAALDGAPARTLFAYPVYASLYLMTGASNPTRFQLLLPAYGSQRHYEEVRHALIEGRAALVVLCEFASRTDDPVVDAVRTHYQPVYRGKGSWGLPCVLYGRRATSR